ncbi:unnamed protein product [Rotaria sordida]|uniref:Actin-binding transcription modulator n=1 Tax=Rotaria sordida TaxID=392033 RepID=A0A815QZ86_9BILA|nr:unnamed protein product [Rotaria sordida]CAF4023953.1 unnamed protein product [Rotaria sordida]
MALAKRIKYPSVIERYYTKYYRTNVHNELNNDMLVLVHSNRVCVLMLSEQHPVIEKSLIINSIESLANINQSMSGKSKRGADYVQPNKLLYRIKCENNQNFTICASIKGRLVELNDEIIKTPELLQNKSQGEGYLAILIPSLKDGENNLKLLINEQDYILSKQSS